jgi:hypothetical protein
VVADVIASAVFDRLVLIDAHTPAIEGILLRADRTPDGSATAGTHGCSIAP